MAVRSVSAGDPIIDTKARTNADRHGLLSGGEMNRSRHVAFEKQIVHALFKSANSHKHVIECNRIGHFITSSSAARTAARNPAASAPSMARWSHVNVSVAVSRLSIRPSVEIGRR